MKRIIHKGMHYCLNFLNFKPYFGSKEYNEIYKVCFGSSCAYDIDTDQRDVNKLFGVSYGWHHNQSDRIGWRYAPTAHEREDIEIVLYSYENGRRCTFPICKVEIGDTFTIKLNTKVYNGYRRANIVVKGHNITIMHKHTNQRFSWGYTLGAFFGGNRTAPHTIKFDLSKVLRK